MSYNAYDRLEAWQRQNAELQNAEFWAQHDAGIDAVNNKILAQELIELYERDPIAYQQRIQFELSLIQEGSKAYDDEMNDISSDKNSSGLFGGISGIVQRTINIPHKRL